jgi:dGTPase
MDIEDAHKLKILSTEETKYLFLSYFEGKKLERKLQTISMVDDTNEQIAYLRSSVIGQLIDDCSAVFLENETQILEGSFNSTLIKLLPPLSLNAYQNCSKTAFEKIYCSSEVLDVELAGYKIIFTLLENW